MRTIVWWRGKDLRIGDHAPLREAAAAGEVIPLFVVDPYFFDPARACALPHRMQFLIDALGSVAANLESRGSRLMLAHGRSVDVIPRLAQAWNADRVVAHRWCEPFARERDDRVAAALGDRFTLYEGETLQPPGTLRTGGGRPYAVFSHFARTFAREALIGRPLPAPRSLPPVPDGLSEDPLELPTLESLGLARNPEVLAGGERAARARLKTFVATRLANYKTERDRMDHEGTSRLSADLKFGTLSPRQIWHAVDGNSAGATAFRNELVWREFSYSSLWDRPELLESPFRRDFVDFPWRDDEAGWRAWTAGQTGYPIVDAASRQLLREGYVHNRARMITASFLTKHLLVHYRKGEAHYMKYLTDGDWANNNAGWQWSAGCGCDAQPYFRVFNPATQGKKFDPDGAYVRRYVPELAGVSARWIHEPWAAPAGELEAAGVRLGRDYPHPIVDHRTARQRFLEIASAHLKR